MTTSIMITGIFFAVFGIVLPGWGLKLILTARGMRFRDDGLSSVLSSFALGIHINAILFLAFWAFASFDHPVRIAAILMAANLGIATFGWLSRKRALTSVDWSVVATLAVGCAVGVFAAYRFPSTLDSIQVLQVQNLLLGKMGGQIVGDGSLISRLGHLLFGGLDVPSQSGFAGLIFIPSLLHWNMPVVTVTAATKILLFSLAALVSLYTARQFRIEYVLFGAALIFANMVLSKFGLYGLFETGKDSIFALLMALASISASLSAEDEQNEPGLYMSCAILLGAISVPYLMMFWGLYFLFSGGTVLKQSVRLAAWSIGPLVLSLVGMSAAFTRHGIFPALVVGALTVLAMSIASNRMNGKHLAIGRAAMIVFAFVPALCIVGIWLIMPVAARILIALNDDVPVTASYAPLDGKMSAVDFWLTMYPMNNPGISVAIVLLSAAAPILSHRFRTPFFLSLFSLLPATTLFALLNLKLNTPLLSHFNIWDITRDANQWCVGLFGVVLTVLGLRAFGARFKNIPVYPALFTTLIFSAGLYLNYPEHERTLNLKPTITQSGGFDDPISAVAMDFAWREARNSTIYVSKDSSFTRDYYSYQMFGAKNVLYFDAAFVGSEREQVFFSNYADLMKILDPAEKNKSSGFTQAVADDAYIVKIMDDGMGQLDTRPVPLSRIKIAGAHDVEAAGQTTFRWVSRRSELTIIRWRPTDQKICPTLKFINGWNDSDLKIKIEGGDEIINLPLTTGANFAPTEIRVCVVPDALGVAKLELTANKPDRYFPNDTRNVSYGLVWPIE